MDKAEQITSWGVSRRLQSDLRDTIQRYIDIGFEVESRNPIVMRRGCVIVEEANGKILSPYRKPPQNPNSYLI